MPGQHVVDPWVVVAAVVDHQCRVDDRCRVGRADLVGVRIGIGAGEDGLDGRRWGAAPLLSAARSRRRDAVRQALLQVNGERLANVRVGVMSGGELQRMRIAQALVSDPMLLLCDEPLLTLDPANTKLVAALIDRRRQEAGTAVIVVTHEVNPILPYVDRVLYLVDGRFRIGTVEQVMTSETLSALYRADIQVVKIKNRYVVVGDPVPTEFADGLAG